MKHKTLSELIEYLDETEEVLSKSDCFCAYDCREALSVAWESIRRLQIVAETAIGEGEQE